MSHIVKTILKVTDESEELSKADLNKEIPELSIEELTKTGGSDEITKLCAREGVHCNCVKDCKETK